MSLEKEKWEIKEIKWNISFQWIKGIVYSAVSIFIFLYITNPDWILKKESVDDQIKRERAKLTLELMELENYEDIIIGLDIIKKAYGDSDTSWITPIELRYRQVIAERMNEKYNPSPEFQEQRKKRAKELKEKYGIQ